MKFTLGRKVWGLSLTVFLLTGIASLCVYSHMSDALAWQKMVVDVKWPAAQIFSDALSSMNMMRSVVREAVLDRDDPAIFAHHVEVYKENREVLDSAISRLETMAKGFQKEENKERVRVISANYREMIAGQDRAFEQAKAGDVKGAAATLRTIVPKGAIVRQKVKELQEQNNTLTSKIFVDMQSDMHAAVNWLLVCFAIVVAIGSAISWRVARQVSGDAEMLCRRAREIASGQLDAEPLTSSSKDEFAELAESVNQMQTQLQQVIFRITSTAQELGAASERITSVSTQTAASSREQTDQTNLVATAIHEMASTVREVSDHSRSASEAAEDASRTARQGGSLVEETRDVMTRIAESNQKVSERVTKLGESSQQVAKIASVIDDIADQTNLLALNAAIEAARAGEQGRGFAVVADEVRKLAERTTAATREIAAILQVILSESQSTAAAIDQSREDVQNGLTRAGKAGEALSQIIGVATRVGDMVSQIATAATEQSSATEEIQGSAERIAGMARETAKAADESASACAQLTGLASNLQEMVGHFRLQESATESSPAVLVRPRQSEWTVNAAIHSTPRRNPSEYSDHVN